MTTPIMDDLATIPWFHRIDLGNGLVTPGSDDTQKKLEEIRLPERLDGQSVLDIGAWDGFFSFEAERRGAARVVAVDGGVWAVPEIGRRGFDFAKETLASQVEPIQMEVLQLGPEHPGVFDLVLFLGVLYHVPHPLEALLRVSACTRSHLILETHVDLLDIERPAIAYYPDDECTHDTTNWNGPNTAAVEAMLRTAGFNRVESLPPLTSVHYPVRGAKPATYGRQVFHAWK